MNGDPTSTSSNNSYYCLTILFFTAKINEDIGGEDGEDMITFDNNAGSDLSSSEDEDGPGKKDDFDLDDIDDVSIKF